jgi:hypothetical protein
MGRFLTIVDVSNSATQNHLFVLGSLSGIRVQVTRRAGKLKFAFTGLPDQVAKAEEILAGWA